MLHVLDSCRKTIEVSQADSSCSYILESEEGRHIEDFFENTPPRWPSILLRYFKLSSDTQNERRYRLGRLIAFISRTILPACLRWMYQRFQRRSTCSSISDGSLSLHGNAWLPPQREVLVHNMNRTEKQEHVIVIRVSSYKNCWSKSGIEDIENQGKW